MTDTAGSITQPAPDVVLKDSEQKDINSNIGGEVNVTDATATGLGVNTEELPSKKQKTDTDTSKQAEEMKEESKEPGETLGPVIMKYKTFEREYIVRGNRLIIITRRIEGVKGKVENEGTKEEGYDTHETAANKLYEHLHKARKTEVTRGKDIYEKAQQTKESKSTRSKKSESGSTTPTESTVSETPSSQTTSENPPAMVPGDKQTEEMKQADTTGQTSGGTSASMLSSQIF